MVSLLLSMMIASTPSLDSYYTEVFFPSAIETEDLGFTLEEYKDWLDYQGGEEVIKGYRVFLWRRDTDINAYNDPHTRLREMSSRKYALKIVGEVDTDKKAKAFLDKYRKNSSAETGAFAGYLYGSLEYLPPEYREGAFLILENVPPANAKARKFWEGFKLGAEFGRKPTFRDNFVYLELDNTKIYVEDIGYKGIKTLKDAKKYVVDNSGGYFDEFSNVTAAVRCAALVEMNRYKGENPKIVKMVDNALYDYLVNTQYDTTYFYPNGDTKQVASPKYYNGQEILNKVKYASKNIGQLIKQDYKFLVVDVDAKNSAAYYIQYTETDYSDRFTYYYNLDIEYILYDEYRETVGKWRTEAELKDLIDNWNELEGGQKYVNFNPK